MPELRRRISVLHYFVDVWIHDLRRPEMIRSVEYLVTFGNANLDF